jgi:hypothetical protein
MRNISRFRSLDERRAADIQSIIDDDPVTVSIYRYDGGDNVTTPRTLTLISSFQGRIDHMRGQYRNLEKHEIPGEAIADPYILLSRNPADKNGNAVIYQRGDTARIGGRDYQVIYKDDSYSYKIDGLLEMIQ